ncbi:MAG: hypothetical protein AAB900_02200 [Patescibacteria group bacterium]
MKNYIIVAIVIILIIAGVVWYSNQGAVTPINDQTATTTSQTSATDVAPNATDVPVETSAQ